jgi:hypothetical protein
VKKKKTWNDGVVMLSGNVLTLYDAENTLSLGNSLESRVLSNVENGYLLQGKSNDIEFDNYIVNVEIAVSHTGKSPSSTGTKSTLENGANNLVQSLKLSKFKVPASVPVKLAASLPSESGINQAFNLGKRSRGAYDLDDEELDNIWKNSVPLNHEEVKESSNQSENIYEYTNTFDSATSKVSNDRDHFDQHRSDFDTWGVEPSPKKPSVSSTYNQDSNSYQRSQVYERQPTDASFPFEKKMPAYAVRSDDSEKTEPRSNIGGKPMLPMKFPDFPPIGRPIESNAAGKTSDSADVFRKPLKSLDNNAQIKDNEANDDDDPSSIWGF